MSYSPSIERPRLKPACARHRATKKKEDEAYRLMGILGFALSVRYGEGDKAFSRLLVEIMRHTDDATLLDWVGQSSSMNSFLPSSPRRFSDAPHMGAQRGNSQGKKVSIFHGNTLLFTCVTSNSSHLHRGNNTNQESGIGESSTARADAAPQLPKTRSNQTIFSLNRSASFPFEESESPLAKLLEKPPTTASRCFANDSRTRSLQCYLSLPTMAGSEEYRQENVLSDSLTHLRLPSKNAQYDFLISSE